MYHLINLFFNSIASPVALNTGCEGFIAVLKEPLVGPNGQKSKTSHISKLIEVVACEISGQALSYCCFCLSNYGIIAFSFAFICRDRVKYTGSM